MRVAACLTVLSDSSLWSVRVVLSELRCMTVIGRIAVRGAARWPGLDSVWIHYRIRARWAGCSQDGMPHHAKTLSPMAY